MPPFDEKKTSTALMALRRATPMNSLVRVGAGADMSMAMTRAILRNVHLALLTRKPKEVETINATENSYAPEQRDDAEPTLKYVRVAVKPPKTPTHFNPFDEAGVNRDEPAPGKLKGLAAMAKKDKPKFVLTEIPYDNWRKHYAKNKLGQYRGTEEPAEDCILLPEDEAKWRPPERDVDASQKLIEDAPPTLAALKRAATSPEFRDIDSGLSDRNEKNLETLTEKEEAVFIESDGHTTAQMIEVPEVDPVSSTLPMSSKSSTHQVSPTLSGSMSPPSPDNESPEISGTRRMSWRERVGSTTGFSKLRRASSAKDTYI